MRYFWSLILLLVLATAGLRAARWSASDAGPGGASGGPVASAAPTPPSFGRPPAAEPERPTATPTPMESTPSEPEVPATPGSAAAADPSALAETRPLPTTGSDAVASTPEPALEPIGQVAAASEAPAPGEPDPAEPETAPRGSDFSLDELLGVVADAAEKTASESTERKGPAEPGTDPMLAAAAAAVKDQTATTPAPGTIASDAAPAAGDTATDGAGDAAGPVGPAYVVRDDGSIEIEEVGVITGAGTAQRPFVLDWNVLRSLSREFNPRQGQTEVPAWVMELHGKRVRVEGNTLLPVVAQTTNELLVMQNPWDGCCLGVPPTPYDAIEVKLARMQRMGNSPTGYGLVEGTFKVDPYIVSGWLLGLYVIDDASFESGAGITLPEM